MLTSSVSTIVLKSAFCIDRRVVMEWRSSIVTNILEMYICLKDCLDADDRNQGRANEIENSPNED